MMYQCNGVPETIRKVPNAIPTATPSKDDGRVGDASLPAFLLERVEPLLVPLFAGLTALIVAGGMMELDDGTFEGVLIVGADPNSMLGSAWCQQIVHNETREWDGQVMHKFSHARLVLTWMQLHFTQNGWPI